MNHWKLTVAYDGTSFFGWQKTAMGPSIQQTLEEAILRITQETVLPEGASRTDRGVHAEAQIVLFSLSEKSSFTPEKLTVALNSILPVAIRVRRAEKTNEAFHPSLHAKLKEYHYKVCLGPVQYPMNRLYSWHYHYPIAIEMMAKAKAPLIGTHDFSAFTTETAKDPICTIKSIDFIPLDSNRLEIIIQGNRFLYKMVRGIVGTLLNIGSGKLPPDSMEAILTSKERAKAGITAPAHGLFLHRVIY